MKAEQQLLSKPLSEILQEAQAEDTGTKGKALEALAFYFMRLLGLEFKRWHKRRKKPEWTEINALAESTHLVFSRWQIQCRNASDNKISKDDVAVEVGLSIQLKSNVILMATTGQFSREAVSYADTITRETGLTIILIDRENLQALATSTQTLTEIRGQNML